MTYHKGIILHKIGKYKIINCNFCKFIHIYPIPSDRKLSTLYIDDYYKKERIIGERQVRYDETINYMNTIIQIWCKLF